MNSINSGSFEFSGDALQAAGIARLSYVRKVYTFFSLGLGTAVVGTLITMNTPGLLMTIAAHPWITFFVIIGAMFFATAMAKKPQMALPAMLLVTFITGAWIAPTIFAIASGYIPGTGPELIYNAFFLTCLIFGGLTAYVFITKKDFSMLGATLTTGLLLVVGVILVNVFIIQSSTLGLAISIITVILFSGFILYNTSRMLRNPYEVPPTVAALSLYIDFFNIFVSLLHILSSGSRRD